MSDDTEGSAAMLGSLANEPTPEQAAFRRWQEDCKRCGFAGCDTPEAMSAFIAGVRYAGNATLAAGVAHSFQLTPAQQLSISKGLRHGPDAARL
jgi:hypothetical protein